LRELAAAGEMASLLRGFYTIVADLELHDTSAKLARKLKQLHNSRACEFYPTSSSPQIPRKNYS
jgi:hypothetical protein